LLTKPWFLANGIQRLKVRSFNPGVSVVVGIVITSIIVLRQQAQCRLAPKAAKEATATAKSVKRGASHPNIARLVNVAKSPAAGVKPPYIQDWNAAMHEPNQY